jgi:hypothetical protein
MLRASSASLIPVRAIYSDRSSAKVRIQNACYTQIHANVTHVALEVCPLWVMVEAKTRDTASLVEIRKGGKSAPERRKRK